MKFRLLALFLLIISLLSCSESKKKYYGEWIMTYSYSDKNQFENIIISNDSISITDFPCATYHKELFELRDGKVKLLDSYFDIAIKNDSILEFNGSEFINKDYAIPDYLYGEKLITIDYPKIENIPSSNSNYSTTDFIYFGRQIDSKEFGLQLNDTLYPFKDIKDFLMETCGNPFRSVTLFCDKNAKMKDVNAIFNELRMLNKRKVFFVNNRKYLTKKNDTIVLSIEAIPLRLTDFKEEQLLYKGEYPPPPPPVENSSLKKKVQNENHNVFTLIDDEFYFNANKVSKDELVSLIKENHKSYLLNFYDDNSNYKSFLELMNAFKIAFYDMRNEESLKKLGKSFNSLNKEEQRKVKQIIPMKVVNGISLNDLNTLGIKVNYSN